MLWLCERGRTKHIILTLFWMADMFWLRWRTKSIVLWAEIDWLKNILSLFASNMLNNCQNQSQNWKVKNMYTFRPFVKSGTLSSTSFLLAPQSTSLLLNSFYGTSNILLEGLGFFISWKRAGKDREDEWHQWPADTSRDVWLRQMSLVTLAWILNPAAQRSTAR